MISDFNVNM